MEQREAMLRMWSEAHRYDKLIAWGRNHLAKFGIKRLLFWKFGAINARLKRYDYQRYLYCTMALAISRKLNAIRRKQRSEMSH